MRRWALAVALLCAIAPASADAGQSLTLIRDGKPTATIVIGQAQPENARRAADELNYHLQRATGVSLAIVDEAEADEIPADQTVVVVGGGALASSLGALQPELADEEFCVKTRGRYVVFVGSDTVRKIEGEAAHSPATLWTVGHFLDRHMGVRWLWPGDLGTLVPKTATITVPKMAVRCQPKMVTRIFGVLPSYSYVRKSRITNAEVAERILAEAAMWNTRHQMGRRERVRSSHSFRHWWEKYHEKHPEVFATLPEGMAQPNPKPDRVKLCVSNPLVAELVLREWREAGRTDVWHVGPNDGQGYCVCEKCRALDVPHTFDADPLDIFWNRSVVSLTGRYLDLWRRLLGKMRTENPNVRLASLAYANYRLAHPDMKPLGHEDALCISLVPDNWSRSERQMFSEWQRLGAKVILRPNFWFVGYEAPYLPLHGAGDFMKYALDKGIVGHSSGILGYWAAQGSYYYLIARLRARPDLSVDEVLDEYASAFGKGAPAIREYLAYWEGVTEQAEYPDWAGHFDKPGGFYERTLTERGLDTNPFWGSFYIMPFLYTDERLAAGHAILDRAEALAGKDDILACRRVVFLRDGLRYLKLTRDVVALANVEIRPKANGPEALREQEARFKRLLVRLKNMRAEMNTRHVVWADTITWHEDRRKVKMSDKYGDGWAFTVVPAEDWGEWRFRKDPGDEGVDQEWHKPDATAAAAWQPIKVPAIWDDTHVGPYQGYGWYRTTFRMPDEWEHESVALTFEAVDEQAWVYLNGQLVGEHTLASESRDIEGFSIGDLWNVPFTILVPVERLTLGGDNTLFVRVHNKVGAGGIWRSVLVQPPPRALFVGTEELGDGITWRPDESHTSFRMARLGSGRAVVTVADTTQGVIMEAGADGAGWALYMHDGRLYFQCGKGRTFREDGQSVIEVPIEAGRHVIEWSADQTRSKVMLRIDGKIAGCSESPIAKYLAGNDAGGIGRIHNVMCRNAAGWHRGDAADFTGTIHSATVWPDRVCF